MQVKVITKSPPINFWFKKSQFEKHSLEKFFYLNGNYPLEIQPNFCPEPFYRTKFSQLCKFQATFSPLSGKALLGHSSSSQAQSSMRALPAQTKAWSFHGLKFPLSYQQALSQHNLDKAYEEFKATSNRL